MQRPDQVNLRACRYDDTVVTYILKVHVAPPAVIVSGIFVLLQSDLCVELLNAHGMAACKDGGLGLRLYKSILGDFNKGGRLGNGNTKMRGDEVGYKWLFDNSGRSCRALDHTSIL